MIKRILIVLCTVCAISAQAADKPNILWILAEDTSPWMGCYGDSVNADATPNIDQLAESGVRFTRAFVPAPVCSPSRSAIIMGRSQIRFGGHERMAVP